MKKQAVVLIHGVGEQVPMDTLRGFVETVWTTDTSAHRPGGFDPGASWSKPDLISGDLELRRITTGDNHEGRRTDFFEFYWAHLMRDTTFAHFRAWFMVLLLRRPSRVPPQLRGVWCCMVAFLGIGIGVVLAWLFGFIHPSAGLLTALAGAWVLVGSWLVHTFLGYAGDAARYLHVAPPNIHIRHQIRQAGIELLQKLHDSDDYDRIIVVGHSLGSVIGYDILTHLWVRHHDAAVKAAESDSSPPPRPRPALEALERLAFTFPSFDSPEYGERLAKYQSAQTEALDELRAQGGAWLVSDFITLGSPLAHADYLLARNVEELKRKFAEREFPVCPPQPETIGGRPRFTYSRKRWLLPHHAAVFGPVRWTNLYFPCRRTLWGDPVGGPIGPLFGPGVRDVALPVQRGRDFFLHTSYWTPSRPWTAAVRQAIRLVTQPKPIFAS